MFNLGFIDLLVFILIGGLSIARLSRLLMNEESFLYTSIIFRYLMGLRYLRSVPQSTVDNPDFDEIQYPEKLSLINTIGKFKNNDLVIYQLTPTTYLSKILGCIFCTSLWLSLIYTYAYLYVITSTNGYNVNVIDVWWGLWISLAIAQISQYSYRKM